jgi:hypothetical protein
LITVLLPNIWRFRVQHKTILRPLFLHVAADFLSSRIKMNSLDLKSLALDVNQYLLEQDWKFIFGPVQLHDNILRGAANKNK